MSNTHGKWLDRIRGRENKTMAEYHVGCGIAGIYAGTLKQNGEQWKNKSDVTHEALCAVAQHLLFGGMEFRFEHKGKWYVMRIDEMEGEQP